ncbi:hypothetical protein [Streptomyces sp. NBC_01361]|nr:hypothetical protein [Streptomyces sp. NBC_01361]
MILPWNLYKSPLIVNYFLGGLGALLGPLYDVDGETIAVRAA